MQHVAEYLNFSEELKDAVENEVFREICPLSSQDKEFIYRIIHHHPNIVLEILNIKNDFQPFSHTVVPFLVNKVTTQIQNMMEVHKTSSLNILNIIQFICYTSVISFTEDIGTKELQLMKITLDVSFQLLSKNLTQKEPGCCCRWFY